MHVTRQKWQELKKAIGAVSLSEGTYGRLNEDVLVLPNPAFAGIDDFRVVCQFAHCMQSDVPVEQLQEDASAMLSISLMDANDTAPRMYYFEMVMIVRSAFEDLTKLFDILGTQLDVQTLDRQRIGQLTSGAVTMLSPDSAYTLLKHEDDSVDFEPNVTRLGDVTTAPYFAAMMRQARHAVRQQQYKHLSVFVTPADVFEDISAHIDNTPKYPEQHYYGLTMGSLAQAINELQGICVVRTYRQLDLLGSHSDALDQPVKRSPRFTNYIDLVVQSTMSLNRVFALFNTLKDFMVDDIRLFGQGETLDERLRIEHLFGQEGLADLNEPNQTCNVVRLSWFVTNAHENACVDEHLNATILHMRQSD